MSGGVLRPEDLAFLEERRVAHLATADAAGYPHVVPVCFVHVAGRLYVPIDAKPKRANPHALKRLANVRERPEAVLLADRYDEDWRRLRWLQIRAQAFILTQGEERDLAVRALEHRYPQYAAMGLEALGLPVVALHPTVVRRWSPTGE